MKVNLVSESEFTVQGHGVHTAFVEMKNQLAKQPSVELTVNGDPSEHFDITHIHTVGVFSLRRLNAKNGGKKIVSAHIVPDSLIGSLVGADLWSPAAGKYLKWFYNKADAVIAVSPYTKNQLVEMGVSEKKIRVLENSIDTTKYKTSAKQKREFREMLGFTKDDFVVVGNGQIQPRKKFDTFAKIAESLPEFQFVWVGGIPFKAAGADFSHLSKLMQNPPKNLRVTDVIPLETAGMYMRAADAMFMPSSQETFGLAIIEGAASGLPVLVRDIPDYDATFGNLILRGKTDDDFRETLLRLKTDKNFAKFARASSRKLAAKYDSAAATEKLLALYNELSPEFSRNYTLTFPQNEDKN